MHKYDFTGLEIAPTRIFPEQPYELLPEAALWSDRLQRQHGFSVSSMQSIWFGRQEKMFGTDDERYTLLAYTKKAIDFASAVGCGNLVFGCPRNRTLPTGTDPQSGIDFFRELGDYAARQGTVIGMEANPAIYNTNYINRTSEAIHLIRQVDSAGFRLNLDTGTMIENREDISELRPHMSLIHHVHISEPGLQPIEPRKMHQKLLQLLSDSAYNGFISIEMGKVEDLSVLEEKMKYVRSILP